MNDAPDWTGAADDEVGAGNASHMNIGYGGAGGTGQPWLTHAATVSAANTAIGGGGFNPPDAEPDAGVREPRNPITPVDSGSIALPTTREDCHASH